MRKRVHIVIHGAVQGRIRGLPGLLTIAEQEDHGGRVPVRLGGHLGQAATQARAG